MFTKGTSANGQRLFFYANAGSIDIGDGTFLRFPNGPSTGLVSQAMVLIYTFQPTGTNQGTETWWVNGKVASQTTGNLCLDENPPVIFLKAGDTKNKRVGEVAVPDDLAAALKTYIAGKDPGDILFPFPKTSGSIVDILRRDLEGAGIVWELPSGEVIDFHSLRATAVCWWLEQDPRILTPKRVQMLARMSTIALLDRYSRNLRMGDYSWLNQGPKLVDDDSERKVG